ncbi:serine/threonine-protein kinase [Stieleria marina]|uniref:Serine/threonine-protein kinase PrkC n=1 Tax=Stieleria marina TaxID=1930275 RepID=A0A517NW87_9BACT|nr:Serine/threonine-protein kinase PrkC [Planctomycetes bacterium K23_9]
MAATKTLAPLRVRSRLGKYRLDRRIGEGGFATVFAATDTLLGIKVALKIPHADAVTPALIAEFRREARLTMQLDHPNILPIRDASIIDGYFAIVSPLAKETLDDRIKRRIKFETAFDILTQLFAAAAYAHDSNVIHCDIKPENVLLFDDNRVRLGDFGIAKAAMATVSGAGTGTVGFMSPDQAMGRPSKRSDVFSMGLIAYRMFAGVWPEYPFEWPMAGVAPLRRRAHPDLIALIRKSIAFAPRHRYRDAPQMLKDWEKTRLKAIRFSRRR